jgi:hypothetical protein
MISWLLRAHTSPIPDPLPALPCHGNAQPETRISWWWIAVPDSFCLVRRRYACLLRTQSYFAKRAVVAEPEERKANTLMQQLHTMHTNRVKKRKAKLEEKRQARQKTHTREDIRSEELAKKARKRRFVEQGQEQKKRARTAASAERKGGGGRGQVGDGD